MENSRLQTYRLVISRLMCHGFEDQIYDRARKENRIRDLIILSCIFCSGHKNQRHLNVYKTMYIQNAPLYYFTIYTANNMASFFELSSSWYCYFIPQAHIILFFGILGFTAKKIFLSQSHYILQIFSLVTTMKLKHNNSFLTQD